MDLSPLTVLRQAIRAVPAVKWALGVGGILATVALAYTFKLCSHGAVPTLRNYAAFFPFSAIPTSARKMPAAPLSRAVGESHSSKNTTFMSGRTRAPAGCLAM
jgi:hypothetical protein